MTSFTDIECCFRFLWAKQRRSIRSLGRITAREAAKEAAADGLAMTFAPMLDVARDPRWGRIAEGPGEDPLVGARMAEAKVRGFQGADLCASGRARRVRKTLLRLRGVTAGREYASVDISERTLQEVHLLPFAAAVSAGVAAIMPAFTDLTGIPMTANRALLRDWLRERLRIQWRHRQRLQRHRGVDPPRHCGGPRRGGGPRAEGRCGYRHDGQCLSVWLAGRIGARRWSASAEIDAVGAARA